ncbi:hypothetical protein T05_6438 [Trichinella murrelli]|uniref:Uncharacterized protein n=1 Tax=Trichinella murrelli TaxID=144512 RepID=A0A0V0UA66_9BILA|nr:hypothetical protein T05_6438 [Trichinella murrelli]
MADVPELHLVPNRCEIWSNSVDKEGCGGAIWTNLDVTSVIKQNDHMESCPRSAEETKPIPSIYDEEASAASAKPCTSGHFPIFKQAPEIAPDDEIAPSDVEALARSAFATEQFPADKALLACRRTEADAMRE